MKKFTVTEIVTNAIQIGFPNAIPILGAVVLWLLTIWIPYLNVGTTIGLIGMVAKMGRGHSISPTEIFNPEYRKQMGEFFLVMIFLNMGMYIGMAFLIIPGIAIAMAWSLSVLLVLDKGMSPIDALKKSNDLTYGSKFTMFLAMLAIEVVIVVAVVVGGGIVGWILSKISETLASLFGVVLIVAAYVAIIAAMMGAWAYIYNKLVNEDQAAIQP